ncbi:hypothetical protein BC828DRAFT_257606 [Blastocladiella britannica]|nr:hypothetical protein BC828DRAFT_257606 [Blastocladiella britannica]
MVTYLRNLRELSTNLIVLHTSYNVHKALEAAKSSASGHGRHHHHNHGGMSQSATERFRLFELGQRATEFNRQLAQLGFPDVRPIHLAMDNVVPAGGRAGLQSLCYTGLENFLDVVQRLAAEPVVPVQRVSFAKLELVRQVDVFIAEYMIQTVDTLRAEIFTLTNSAAQTQMLEASDRLASIRVGIREAAAEIARYDTDDQVEIDPRTCHRVPVTMVREGTRRALAVLAVVVSPTTTTTTSKTTTSSSLSSTTSTGTAPIRAARLVQPAYPRCHIRHEHIDANRYVAVLSPPPSHPWASQASHIHVQLFTHRRDAYATELVSLRHRQAELEGSLDDAQRQVDECARRIGADRTRLAALELRLETVRRGLRVVQAEKMPLELFVEVADQYREIAMGLRDAVVSGRAQGATSSGSSDSLGRRLVVDPAAVRAVAESVERFFYRRV